MTWDNIFNCRYDQLESDNINDIPSVIKINDDDNSYKSSSVTVYDLRPVKIDTIFSRHTKEKEDRVSNLKNFFFMEHDQIDCLLRVIWINKHESPFGISFDTILDTIAEYEKFYLFKSKQYILSILNTLALKEIGILSIKLEKEENQKNSDIKEVKYKPALFDLTRFGVEFMEYSNRI